VDLAGFALTLDTLGATTLTASTALRPYQTLIAYRETA
jgi:hypothetical protein